MNNDGNATKSYFFWWKKGEEKKVQMYDVAFDLLVSSTFLIPFYSSGEKKTKRMKDNYSHFSSEESDKKTICAQSPLHDFSPSPPIKSYIHQASLESENNGGLILIYLV